MMQQVATSNADIAAFAANTPPSDQQEPAFAKEFGKVLQQQQDSRDSSQGTKKSTNKTAEPVDKAASDNVKQPQKNGANVAAEKETKNTAELEQSVALKSDKKSPEQIQENSKKTDNKSSILKTNGSIAEGAGEEKHKLADTHTCSAGCAEESLDSKVVGVSDTELAEQIQADINELVRQFELAKISAKDTEIETSIGREKLVSADNSDLEEAQIAQDKHQDWSSLVDKLHTLASSNSEKVVSAEDKQLLGEDIDNHVQQSIENKLMSPEELAVNLLEVQGAESKTTAHFESANIEINQPQVLANVVAEFLNEIDTSKIKTASPETKMQVDSLVNKLAALQGVLETSKTAKMIEQVGEPKGNTEKGQLVGLETNVATTNEVQQSVLKSLQASGLKLPNEQLAEPLNKSLIATVVGPDSTAKDSQNVDPLKPNMVALDQESGAEGQASIDALADVQNQLQHNITASPSEMATASNKALEVLAGMSTEKLDKTLNNLLQRLTIEQSNSEVQNAQLKEQQANGVAANPLAQLVPEQASKDFIMALKAGVDEFKAQLAQGREPGMDLKSLVADVINKSADTSGPLAKHAEQVELAVKGFSQVLDFAQQLNGALEQNHANTVSQNNYMAREVGQSQLDQLKQFQAQNSQFDKAVNISKPEGHQQLAEKVRWMVNAKQLVAEIRLDPADLGSMQVKVSVTGESANISFVVQSQQARDAMENATPRLREMLADKGIELGQSSVEQEQGTNDDKEQLAGQQNSGANQGFDDANESPNETFIQQPIVNGALGGIDYFV